MANIVLQGARCKYVLTVVNCNHFIFLIHFEFIQWWEAIWWYGWQFCLPCNIIWYLLLVDFMPSWKPVHIIMNVYIHNGDHTWLWTIRNWGSTSRVLIISKERDDSFSRLKFLKCKLKFFFQYEAIRQFTLISSLLNKDYLSEDKAKQLTASAISIHEYDGPMVKSLLILLSI